MTEEHSNTENKILDAARQVFVENGFESTRMQQIADVAGINKALLHYYYRTKEKLFEAIFKEVIKHYIPRITELIGKEMSFEEKLTKLIDYYIQLLGKNPHVPVFILKELNRNPKNLVRLFRNSGINPDIVIPRLKEELNKNGIDDLDTRHYLVTLISLCVFPFAARPLLQELLFEGNREKYQEFLDERKAIITDMVLEYVRNRKSRS